LADFPNTWDYGLVDDGGLRRGEPIAAFEFIGGQNPIAGKCLIFGVQKDGGDTCDAAFNLSTLISVVRWLGVIVPKVDWVREGNVDRAVVTWVTT
jgi:hypothetical protein